MTNVARGCGGKAWRFLALYSNKIIGSIMRGEICRANLVRNKTKLVVKR